MDVAYTAQQKGVFPRHLAGTVSIQSNQIKSNIAATQKAECNIATKRICREDTKAAVQNCTNRCPRNTH